MATSIAGAVISDHETLEEIQIEDSEFFGSDCSEENPIAPPLLTDEKKDEYLSGTEEESNIRSGIGQISLPTSSSDFDMLQDNDETRIVTDELQKGCGCSEMCYQQFHISEVRDFQLSMKELDKHE